MDTGPGQARPDPTTPVAAAVGDGGEAGIWAVPSSACSGSPRVSFRVVRRKNETGVGETGDLF